MVAEEALLDSPQRQPRRPIGRAAVEQLVASASAIAGLLLGLQCIPFLLEQMPPLNPQEAVPIVASVYLALSLVWLAALAHRYRRTFNGVFAAVFVLAAVVWPLIVAESGAATDRPWLWQLLNVATACAGVAFSAWWAGAYAVLVPIGFSAICMLPGGGSIPLKTAVLDAGLGIIVGVVTVILMTLFRSVGARVDKSQSDALRQFAATARAEAAETERLYVDALVHDSVLTTLLVASRAESPESRRLATAMAETAISRLESPGTFDEGGGARVAVGTLHDRLRALVSSISLPIDVTLTGDPSQTMPSAVAEAIYSATVQAVQNSLQHAGFDDQIKRFITMTVTPPAHVVVAIGDTGRGFDQASVPTERLGLSKSIIARVASVKGLATVDSAPGSGTIISIAWGDAS